MIKAIETRYKGYRFRSRLEAKWAVYFDALGIEWEYEVEGFDLGELGWYLPDFWFPRHQTWAEVKRGRFSTDEVMKCCGLAIATDCIVAMLDGQPDCKYYDAAIDLGEDVAITQDENEWDFVSYKDRAIVIERYISIGSYVSPIGHGFAVRDRGKAPSDDGYWMPTDKNALNVSRSARFEFGEHPVVSKPQAVPDFYRSIFIAPRRLLEMRYPYCLRCHYDTGAYVEPKLAFDKSSGNPVFLVCSECGMHPASSSVEGSWFGAWDEMMRIFEHGEQRSGASKCLSR